MIQFIVSVKNTRKQFIVNTSFILSCRQFDLLIYFLFIVYFSCTSKWIQIAFTFLQFLLTNIKTLKPQNVIVIKGLSKNYLFQVSNHWNKLS